MLNTIFRKTQKIHFIGIGGIGMCGIAELLKDWGFEITGSDTNASENTRRLESLGIPTLIGHRKENVPNCDVVVYSSAVQPDNPERIAALERKIPIIRRAEMLGEIFKLKPTRIAISGTHGKTTTTSMIGQIFIEPRCIALSDNFKQYNHIMRPHTIMVFHTNGLWFANRDIRIYKKYLEKSV